MSEPRPLSNTEKGVLLYVIRWDMYWHEDNSYARMCGHKRGTSYYDVITHSQSARIFESDIALEAKTHGKIKNPYRDDSAQTKKAIIDLMEQGYLTAYKNNSGTVLVPNATAIEALVQAEILTITPVIADYLAELLQTGPDPRPQASVDELGKRKNPPTAALAAIEKALNEELGDGNEHTQRILDRLNQSKVQPNKR